MSLLLPSGRVMMAGWNNSSIEIFDSPYMLFVVDKHGVPSEGRWIYLH